MACLAPRKERNAQAGRLGDLLRQLLHVALTQAV